MKCLCGLFHCDICVGVADVRVTHKDGSPEKEYCFSHLLALNPENVAVFYSLDQKTDRKEIANDARPQAATKMCA